MKDLKNIKIAYIGGGSRAWARNLMVDLAKEDDMAGTVALYDIDYEAAKVNEKIGDFLYKREDVPGKWKYVAEQDLKSALTGADFVIISVLPGTFDEMDSDVHTPEKYGIYQSVGDTVGPGGIVRALRTIPIFEKFALAIKEYCPNAWVINFTNPMTMCVKTLYKVFPQIKAIGCCHEVFGTQAILSKVVEEYLGEKATRDDIVINVLGVNHFTWLTEARYKGVDLLPLYKRYIEEHPEGDIKADNEERKAGGSNTKELVKFDLFKRYGVIAAAGDRHLAEFCPGKWYLKNPETVEKYGFGLTTVQFRKSQLKERIDTANKFAAGEKLELYNTGEESVRQIRALLGLGDFVTNVNMPNCGQMAGAPLGAVVETNVYMTGDSVKPVCAGELPVPVAGLVNRIIATQETVVEAALEGDYERVFTAFLNDANMDLSIEEARELFDAMLYNTREYLPYYGKYLESRGK